MVADFFCLAYMKNSFIEDASLILSLFNGVSIFVGYLMPMPFSEKNSSGTI